MSGRPEKKRRDAAVVADSLAEIGLKRHAQIIRDLVRSSSSSSQTNQLLHRDNLELRRRIAELEGEK